MSGRFRNSTTAVKPTRSESASAAANRRMQESVYRILSSTRCHMLAGVKVCADQGQVELTGRVPSYYAKQLATEAVINVPGVTKLRNSLIVLPR